VSAANGFEIIEMAAPKVHLDDIHRDPYREQALQPGITIRWKDDKLFLRIGIVVFVAAFCVAAAVAWAFEIRGAQLPLVPLIAWTLGAVAVAWIGRMMWHDEHWVRADHEGLHWASVAWTSRVIEKRVSSSEIAEFVVRDETEHDDNAIVIPSFVLYARDRRGRDRAIADFEDSERARWLQTRVRHHLGIGGQ